MRWSVRKSKLTEFELQEEKDLQMRCPVEGCNNHPRKKWGQIYVYDSLFEARKMADFKNQLEGF